MKKAFPMGYRSPQVKAFADTPAGQKQTLKTHEQKVKAAVKADIKNDYKPPIHGKRKK